MTGWRDIKTAPRDRDILVKGGIVNSRLGKGAKLLGVAHVIWIDGLWVVEHPSTYEVWIDSPTHWHPVPEV